MNRVKMARFLRTKSWINHVNQHSNYDIIAIQADDVPPEGLNAIRDRGWYFNSHKITGDWFHLEPMEKE